MGRNKGKKKIDIEEVTPKREKKPAYFDFEGNPSDYLSDDSESNPAQPEKSKESNDIDQSQKKTQQVQKQVDEVKDIMHQNIKKVVERGENIQSIDQKTEELHQSSQQFHKKTVEVKKKMWWKHLKYQIIFIVLGILLICGIVFTLLKALAIMK